MEEKHIGLTIEDLKDEDKLNTQIELFFSLSKKSKLELLTLLAKLKEEVVGRFLNMVYEREEDKEVSKQIKKVLHILKTKGIAVDEPTIKGAPVFKLKYEPKDKKVKSFITNFDYYNQMVVLLGLEVKNKNFLIVNSEIEFPTGLIDQTFTPCPKEDFHNVINTVLSEKTDKLTMVEAPVVFSYSILKQASALSKRFIDETNAIKNILKENTTAFKKEFDVYNLSIPTNTVAHEIEKIFAHPYFELFRFKWDGIEEDKRTFNDIKDPSIILPEYLIDEKERTFIDSLVKKNEVVKLIPFLKTVFEVYAFIFYANSTYDYYKGIIDYLKEEQTLFQAIQYFIRKELEYEKDRDAFEDGEKLIITPYDL